MKALGDQKRTQTGTGVDRQVKAGTSIWTVLGLGPMTRHQEPVNPTMAHAYVWGYEF